jgi:hypothetical protein
MSEESPIAISWPLRVGLLASGLVVPIVSLRIARELSEPAWQSGDLSAYASLFLANTAPIFLPFLAYAIGSFVLALFAGDRAARHFAVRFGIYSGMILSVQFIVGGLVAVGGDRGGVRTKAVLALACGLGGTLVPLGLGWAAFKITRRRGPRWIWWSLLIVEIVFTAIVVVAPSPIELVAAVAYAAVAESLVAAPFWSLATYVGVSVFVYRRYGGRGQFRLSDAMCLMSWLAAYLATLRISVTRAVEQYAQLPTTPPHRCYVSTAAARGHPRFVHSEQFRSCDGSTFAVNWQMRRLKTAEIALAATSPRLHSALRRWYDRVGPCLAARIAHPLAADAAYLLLKPAEWLATIALIAIVPNLNLLASQVYGNDMEPMKEGWRLSGPIRSQSS